MPLDRLNTRTIDRHGRHDPAIHAHQPGDARGWPSCRPPGAPTGPAMAPTTGWTSPPRCWKNLEFLGLDGLIVIGGDDTLELRGGAGRDGVPVWGIPKTMDNDVPGTEYCIGFQTAISRAAEFIGRIRSTAGSHRETVLFRMFGRDAGFTALETAIVTWSRPLLIPEVPVDVDPWPR